jgi:hypothetical protein
MADARTGALAILREGRLQVLAAIPDPETGDTIRASARVEGHHGIYAVDLDYGVVTCTAKPDVESPNAQCAHAYALRLVTGGF